MCLSIRYAISSSCVCTASTAVCLLICSSCGCLVRSKYLKRREVSEGYIERHSLIRDLYCVDIGQCSNRFENVVIYRCYLVCLHMFIYILLSLRMKWRIGGATSAFLNALTKYECIGYLYCRIGCYCCCTVRFKVCNTQVLRSPFGMVSAVK